MLGGSDGPLSFLSLLIILCRRINFLLWCVHGVFVRVRCEEQELTFIYFSRVSPLSSCCRLSVCVVHDRFFFFSFSRPQEFRRTKGKWTDGWMMCGWVSKSDNKQTNKQRAFSTFNSFCLSTSTHHSLPPPRPFLVEAKPHHLR